MANYQLRRVYNQIGKKKREVGVLLMRPSSIRGRIAKIFSSPGNQQLNIPANWIVNQNYKFIYCPIPKAASSSMLNLVLLLSDLEKKDKILQEGGKMIRTCVASHLQISSLNVSIVEDILADPDYFTFTVVRNPWSRLVSAYLDKFVINKNTAISSTREIEKKIYKQQGKRPDYKRSITFRQFVDYVSNTEDSSLNPHWRSQHTFLSDFKFDYIGHLETLDRDFEYIKKRLSIDIELPYAMLRKASYLSDPQKLDNAPPYFDWFPNQLKKMQVFPKYKEFYDSDMKEKVRIRYKADIERFLYDFDGLV